MKKIILLLFSLCACPGISAQTTVNGNVTDTGSQAWFGGTWQFQLIARSGTPKPQQWYIGGSNTPVPNQNVSGAMDGSGNFTQILYPNSQISPENSIWQLTVCPLATSGCFAETLRIAPGPTQSVNPNPPAISIDMQTLAVRVSLYSDTEATNAQPGQHYWNLTNAVTRICNASPCSGGNWINFAPGGGNPGGSTTQIQFNNSGNFGGATGITTPDGNILTIKGTSPWADVKAFGARANVISLLDGSTTGTMNATSNSLAIAGIGFGGNWVNGDGITIQGAGATFTLSTPSAPTVTPSFLAGEAQTHDVVNSNTGASSYSYCVVVRDKFGGLSPCSTTTTIANGLSSLGLQTANVTAVSLSNDTLTVTSTTNLVSHTLVDLTGITGYPWTSWARVATNPGTTLTFTAYPIDSRAMPSNTKDITTGVSVGGTLAYYTLNYVSWTAVTGAWEYYICAERPGDGSFHLIGVTRPNDSGYLDTSFEDLGSTYLGSAVFPYYATDAICTGAGQNDPLTTTITAGAGTTTLTLAANATNSVSGTKVVHDSAPNILAAANSVSGSVSPNLANYIYIPPGANINDSYPINSFLQLPSKVNILMSGNLLFGETMETNSNVIDGRYANLGVPQFGTCGGAQLISPNPNGANPSLYFAGSANVLKNVSISTKANSGLNAVSYGGNLTMDCTAWTTQGGSSDYAGINLIFETNGALSNDFFSNSVFITGPDQVNDKSWTPNVWTTNNGQTGGADVKLTQINWNRRGMAISGATVDTDWTYRQGGITPMFAQQEAQSNGWISVKDEFQDTEGQPVVANWNAGTPPQPGGYVVFKNVQGGGTSLLVQGNRVTGEEVENYTSGSNNSGGEQNRALHVASSPVTYGMSSPYSSGGGTVPAVTTVQRFGQPLVMQGGYSMGAALNPPTSITCANAAGGSVPNGTYVYTLSSIDYRGGSSMIQPQISTSCTATTGNNTNNLTWSAALGAVTYNVYRAATSSTCISGYTANGCGFTLVASGVTGTSYSDTSATTTNNAPMITAGFISGMDNTATWTPLLASPESTAPSAITGFDILYPDSSAHAFKECANAGSCFQLPQTICSGQIALSTGAINSGTRATNTLSCSGLSATTDRISCTFSGDTNAVTGYAPSASGGLTLKTWVSTNTINVDQVNDTGGSITPGAATINCAGTR